MGRGWNHQTNQHYRAVGLVVVVMARWISDWLVVLPCCNTGPPCGVCGCGVGVEAGWCLVGVLWRWYTVGFWNNHK